MCHEEIHRGFRVGGSLRRRIYSRLRPRGLRAWRRVCEPRRARAKSHPSPVVPTNAPMNRGPSAPRLDFSSDSFTASAGSRSSTSPESWFGLSRSISRTASRRVRFRASRTLSRHRRMRQKRASDDNRNQMIFAISITFPGRWHCAMRDIFNPQTRWSKKMDTSRRRLLVGVGGLSLGAAVSAVQPRQATANETSSVAGSEGGEELVAVAVNDALEGAYGRHKGKRRNHTKGFGTTGYFVGTKEAAQLSRSALFDGDRIEVIGRFSIAVGDPSASDS